MENQSRPHRELRRHLDKEGSTLMLNVLCVIPYVITLGVGMVIAHWKLLPYDLSPIPLAVIAISQCCLLGLWLAHCSASWQRRILVAIGTVALTSSVRWIMDGMPLPANMFWLSIYALDGLVPLAGVTTGAMLLAACKKQAEFDTRRRIRFSVFDLLFVTSMFSIATVTLMRSSPNLSEYQYTFGFGDSAQRLVISTLLVVASTLIVFRIAGARVLRVRALTMALLSTLIAGVLAASFFGIDANPLWASYVLAPCATTLLVTLALLFHRGAAVPRTIDNGCEPRRETPNNKPLHMESRIARFMGAPSFPAAR